MAILSGFKRDRMIFIATTAFVITFAIILAIAYAMQLRVSQSDDYRLTSNAVEQWLKAGDTVEAKSALNAMQSGGKVQISGKTLELAELNKFLAPDSFDAASLAKSLDNGISDQAKAKATQLNEIIIGKHAKRKKLAATMMIVGAIVTLLLYFALIIPMFARRQDEEEVAVVAKGETEGIMNTVSEGLFLLGSDHQIGVEQSASLKRMFKLERDLEGDFFDFISDYVTQENVRVAKDYLELLFGDRVKEKLVEDLNPLNNVEISLVRRDGQYENRYLDFRFKRVMVDGSISHLLGSVSDVTRQVELEKQLAETKEEQEAQVDLLMSILHIDRSRLQTFITTSTKTLEDINERLSERGHSDGQIRSKLGDIMSSAHRLKGDAAALGLHKFEFGAHDFEEELEKIKRTEGSLGGKDLLPAITKLRNLYSEMDKMTDLIDKFSEAMNSQGGSSSKMAADLTASIAGGEQNDAPAVTSSIDAEGSNNANAEGSSQSTDSAIENVDMVDLDSVNVEDDTSESNVFEDSIRQLCDTVGGRNDTKVALNLNGFDGNSVPEKLTDVVNDSLIQLVRNSIVHGYEGAEQREAAGKQKDLGIKVDFEKSDKGYVMTYRDDGQGLNSKLIAEKAVERKLLTAEAAENMDKNRIIKLLFHPGFSTLDEATLDGGRGVGLDVVLKRVKEHGGAISISSGLGSFSQFTIRFPHNN